MRRWRRRERGKVPVTIYEHIRAHLHADGPGLMPGGEVLPDEDEETDQLKWAPGALDGVASHHMGFERDDAQVDQALGLIRGTVESELRLKNFGRLYEWVRTTRILGIVDPLLDRIRQSSLPPAELRELGVRLVTESRHREPVKLGISLIGLIVPPRDREILLVLGRHDEFTLFCAVALQGTESSPDRALWDLAKTVDGWGRVQLVERLKDTQDPDIKDWILREGFRNSIMDEYLAYIAATTGDLASALEASEPDDEVLTAACDIISALLVGGPAEDIDDYADAPRAVELLVGHLEGRAATVSHFLILHDLAEFLTKEVEESAERKAREWPAGLRERLAEKCRDILRRDIWRRVVEEGLESDDPMVSYRSDRAARILGVDSFDAHWRRLVTDPLGGNWYAAMRSADEEKLGRLLELARESLPLEAIASGPADSLGLGPEFRPHQALGFIVQDLKRFPGRGWEFVAAALRSPVIPNRNMALGVLDAWPKNRWPSNASDALKRAEAEEPREDVKERIGRVRRGEPLDPGDVQTTD